MAEVEEELNQVEEFNNVEEEQLGEGIGEGVDLSTVKLEVVAGNKESSRWLIVDGIHICHQQQETEKDLLWRCEDYRHFKCPFKITTTKLEGENELKVVSMTNAELHTCAKDKVRPIVHKFRLKLANRMRKDVDVVWRKVWEEERTLLLDGLKEQPELTSQLLMELKDSRSFRDFAQRARARDVPKIPHDHKDMDPEKVKSFKVCYIFVVKNFSTSWS